MKKFPAALAAAALVGVGLGVATPAHAVTSLAAPTGLTTTYVGAYEVDLEWTDPNLSDVSADDSYTVTFTNVANPSDTGSFTTTGSRADSDPADADYTVDAYAYFGDNVDIAALAGDTYNVTITATDDNEVRPDSAPSGAASFTTPGPYLQTPDDLTLSGSWTVGGTVTATATAYPGDTSAGSWTTGAAVSYQWILDPHTTYSSTAGYQDYQGTVFATTTSPRVALPAAALGHVVGVRAVGHKAGYQDGELTNNYWSLHTVTAGMLTMGTPKVTGKAKVGKKVKVSTGTWTAGTTFSYKWLANGKPVKGKKGKKAVLKLTRNLKGQKVSVQVTAHAPAGYTPAVVTSGTVVTTKAKKVK